jgi:serine/threonine protein kinase
LILLKVLRKCPFGEIYLSIKENSNEYFITKRIKTEINKEEHISLSNEICFLQSVNHPNIIKLERFIKSKNNYYITYEYINGYYLSECLQKYKIKFNKAFPELFIQHLMRQILEALAFIHEKEKILINLNINNILVNFDSKNDQENINMKNTKIKLIDFSKLFSLDFEFKRERFETRVCTFDLNIKLNYEFNYYIDILCLGNICYELLTGKPAFDVKSLLEPKHLKGPNDLYEKIKEGIDEISSLISSEFASFLKDIFNIVGHHIVIMIYHQK